MMKKKSKQQKVDEWVIRYLKDKKVELSKPHLENDKIPWTCPECGTKYRFILPINLYVASYVFECEKCDKAQRVRTNHFHLN